MISVEELAKRLKEVQYDYIFSDYYADNGAFFELDATGLAQAILDWMEEKNATKTKE